jgi:hypothetical protein
VRTEWFFLENLPTGTKGLVPGRGTATIGLYHAISGPADSSTEQRVRIFPTRR